VLPINARGEKTKHVDPGFEGFDEEVRKRWDSGVSDRKTRERGHGIEKQC
jgi:hypothetical protein